MYVNQFVTFEVCTLTLKLLQYPETASFLTDKEKVIVSKMLEEDTQGLATHFNIKFVWQAMTDYKAYLQVGIYIGQYFFCKRKSTRPARLIDDLSRPFDSGLCNCTFHSYYYQRIRFVDILRGSSSSFIWFLLSGFTAADAQLLTIPPFVIGCVATIAGFYSNFPGLPILIGL